MSAPSNHTPRSGQLRIGVDIGGTFTDMVVMDDMGIIEIGKVLTTPAEPSLAVEQVIESTLAQAAVRAEQIASFIHGTTLVTNALIERKGSLTALLTTGGFRDTLEMAREHRYDLYDLSLEFPKPLVPRWLRFDVPERMHADGTVRETLDENFVKALTRELVEHGVEAVAICFLHSYKNPAHEEAARRAVLEVAPHLRVALSSEVVPEIREYERTSTTVANVYVQELVHRYLDDLRQRSARLALTHEPNIMLSNGGIATVDTASAFPIRMLESGPAGGALAAAAFGKAADRANLLAFDMGGTTAKLCLIEDGEPLVAHQFEVDRVYRMKPGSGLPVKVPVIDMIEIGVGGGSIARLDALGLLTVGPDSAGSVPGPACYGRGGTLPTVTDADLVLGYLNPDYFLGGKMDLDLDAARRAIQDTIATPLGVSLEQAAYGIHSNVNANMANAARVHAIERGRDPVGQPLFTSGGAGPVHGAGVARALGTDAVICPPGAGVMSAAGFLTAPLALDFVRSSHALVDDLDDAEVEAIFRELEAKGEAVLTQSGLSVAEVEHRRAAEVRYEGQGFEVTVALPSSSSDWRSVLAAEFRRQYEMLYKREGPDVPIEVLSWRVVSAGPAPVAHLTRTELRDRPAGDSCKAMRSAYFAEAGGMVRTPVHDRYVLAPGDQIDGPAIVEERESTLIVPPDAHCEVEADGSLIVRLRLNALTDEPRTDSGPSAFVSARPTTGVTQ
jgi:N-methylhydantoinase A